MFLHIRSVCNPLKLKTCKPLNLLDLFKSYNYTPTKMKSPIHLDRAFHFGIGRGAGESNHVRKPRWGLHEPVQTLANTFILFACKKNASDSLPSLCKNRTDFFSFLFFFFY